MLDLLGIDSHVSRNGADSRDGILTHLLVCQFERKGLAAEEELLPQCFATVNFAMEFQDAGE